MKEKTTDRITVWWPKEDIAKLKALAAARNTSAATVLLTAFGEYVKTMPPSLKKALDAIATEAGQEQ